MKITAEHRVKIVQYDDPIIKMELSAVEAVELRTLLECSLVPRAISDLARSLGKILDRYNIDTN